MNAREQEQLDKALPGRFEIVAVGRLDTDKFGDMLRPLSEEEFKLLTESIRANGITDPLKVVESGNGKLAIVDGCHRLKAAEETGRSTVPVCILEFADGDKIREFILINQLGRRNITAAERDEILGRLYELQKKEPHRPAENKVDKMSTFSRGSTAERLAKEHGVDAKTVRRAAKRVKWTDKHPEYRENSTAAIRMLEEAVEPLTKKEQASLLGMAESMVDARELNARDISYGARLIAEKGLAVKDAYGAVLGGLAKKILDGKKEITGGPSFKKSGADEDAESEPSPDSFSLEDSIDERINELKEIIESQEQAIAERVDQLFRVRKALAIILMNAEHEGADVAESPWADIQRVLDDEFGEAEKAAA